ncbi:MAG: DNA/RNA non-specific endonuclease [Muribaculaceae bacterium]|nr:DNA/RNA non-specific endonuclease [Muribaculaceae bacterium]
MARRKKRRDAKWRYARRLLLVGSWVLLLVVILGAVLRWGVTGARRSLEIELGARLRDSLEVVKLPDHTPSQVLRYDGFTIYFNKKWHVPNCAVYELTRHEAQGSLPRTGSFVTDSAVAGCARPWDYTLSGYERGHIVPAGDMRWSRRAMAASFVMTNVCPQAKALNQGGWSKLEDKVRSWAVRDSALIVVAGPVLTPGMATIGPRHVAVPKHFFKVVLAPYARPMRAIGFIYPNARASRPLSHYAVSVDRVESVTGYDFFSALPHDVEREVESRAGLDQWLR